MSSVVGSKLDLRGVPCPLNWVHTKLALEEMEEGDLLELLLDGGDAVCNVPRSARLEGQAVVKMEPEEDYYRVLIVKKA